MDEILKKLLDNKLLNEETREEIKSALAQIVAEATEAQEMKVRKELAERYEQDKKAIHTALEQYLEQELSEHVKEFRQGVTEVESMKGELAKKIHAVKSEAQEYVAKRLGLVEKVLESILAKELSEIHEDEKTNRRAYVKAITEAQAKLEADRKAFRSKAAAVLENIVNVQIEGTLTELREDIKAARKSDFGRELFESYYALFRNQFFNSTKEFRALAAQRDRAIKEAKRISFEAKKQVSEAKKQAKAATLYASKLREAHERAKVMAGLLGRLQGPARSKMKTMLESTSTDRLVTTFKAFLPEVLSESKRAPERRVQRKIDEATTELRTGGARVDQRRQPDEFDDEIANIKRLAGNG